MWKTLRVKLSSFFLSLRGLLTKPIPPVLKLVLTVDDTCCLSHLQSAIISPEGYTTWRQTVGVIQLAPCSYPKRTVLPADRTLHHFTGMVVDGRFGKTPLNSGFTDVCLPTASSLSELSSLHDGGTTDFRNMYQTVQMKALPPIADLDDQSVLRAAAAKRGRRTRRDRGNQSDDELDRRYRYSVISCMCVFTWNHISPLMWPVEIVTGINLTTVHILHTNRTPRPHPTTCFRGWQHVLAALCLCCVLVCPGSFWCKSSSVS